MAYFRLGSSSRGKKSHPVFLLTQGGFLLKVGNRLLTGAGRVLCLGNRQFWLGEAGSEWKTLVRNAYGLH